VIPAIELCSTIPPHTNHSSLAILPLENPKSKVVVELGMVPIEK